MPTLTENEWDSRFTEVQSPSGESYWEEDEIRDWLNDGLFDINSVWTFVEADSAAFGFIVTGFHKVNAINYIVTEQPWEPEDIDNEWIISA